MPALLIVGLVLVGVGLGVAGVRVVVALADPYQGKHTAKAVARRRVETARVIPPSGLRQPAPGHHPEPGRPRHTVVDDDLLEGRRSA